MEHRGQILNLTTTTIYLFPLLMDYEIEAIGFDKAYWLSHRF